MRVITKLSRNLWALLVIYHTSAHVSLQYDDYPKLERRSMELFLQCGMIRCIKPVFPVVNVVPIK
jgi:hypothetical protein